MFKDPENTYKAARDIICGSPKGKEIIDEVEANPQFVINLIVTNDFPSMFMDEALNQTNIKGRVTWSGSYCLGVKSERQKPCTGLAHGLGHVVQYMGNRGWYKGYSRISWTALKELRLRREGEIGAGGKCRKAQLVIENDNISKHEAPIARQLGQPVRESYE
jgi:hypothetical protein